MSEPKPFDLPHVFSRVKYLIVMKESNCTEAPMLNSVPNTLIKKHKWNQPKQEDLDSVLLRKKSFVRTIDRSINRPMGSFE
jgi:hypothetical protein